MFEISVHPQQVKSTGTIDSINQLFSPFFNKKSLYYLSVDCEPNRRKITPVPSVFDHLSDFLRKKMDILGDNLRNGFQPGSTGSEGLWSSHGIKLADLWYSQLSCHPSFWPWYCWSCSFLPCCLQLSMSVWCFHIHWHSDWPFIFLSRCATSSLS